MTDRPRVGLRGASPTRGMGLVIFGFACIAVALHASHLLYLAGSQGCHSAALACPVGDSPWAAGDYHSYHAVADEIRERGLTATSYVHRAPGLPVLLVLAEDATGFANPVRWIGPPLAGVAAAAVVWLTGLLSGGRARAVGVAGVLFCAWIANYRYSAALQTDGAHAFVIAGALACSVAWREGERATRAALGALFWVAAQSLRPTLFPLALFLPLLLVKRGASRRYAAISVALWAATLLTPAFVIGVNNARHGIVTSGHVLAVNLGCYAVPRLREDLGEGNFQRLRRRCLLKYRGMAPEQRIPAQYAEAIPILLAQPLATARSFAGELVEQLSHPITFSDIPARASLYPSWAYGGRSVLVVWWVLAAAGLVWVGRERPTLAIFLGVFAVVIMAPATTSHLVGGRLRFPLDVVSIPLVALAIDRGLSSLLGRWERART